MTDIRFYHLQTRPLQSALPEILSKALSQGRRVVVRAADDKAVEALNESLWTFRPDSFLPHGSRKDGHEKDQPVWLTASNDNPNGADVLVLTSGADGDGLEQYALCCDVFDGNDESAVAAARERWKTYHGAGHAVTYWQQTEKGWEKKS